MFYSLYIISGSIACDGVGVELEDASSGVSLGGAISMGERAVQRSVIPVVLAAPGLGWHLMRILGRFGNIRNLY